MSNVGSRDQARVAPLEDVVRTVMEFANLTWPVPTTDVPDLITRLGWTPNDAESTGNTLVAESGWELNRTDADILCQRGELTSVDFGVTDVVLDPHPWRPDFLNDALVDIVTAIAAVLGRPSKTTKGVEPDAMWELANGGRVRVSRIDSSVFVAVSSAEWAEVNRKLGA